ncbi:FAV1 [Candida jiufengensis]|uniref:FAV1 n=1 Tax=Candida jiufengensis TaxID=497108 RepID=UPI0022244512|nr:FAV1 [Candida jiufengensis]KAI5955066.1 FAV1 [Candida jiufengensis]
MYLAHPNHHDQFSPTTTTSSYLLSNTKFVDTYNNRTLLNQSQQNSLQTSAPNNQFQLYDPFEGRISKQQPSSSTDSNSSNMIHEKLKKLQTKDSIELKTNDLKFQYKQHLIEFLNFIIGKYKEFEHNLKINGFLYNDSLERNLVFLNLVKLNNGYKNLIMNLLNKLNSISTCIDKNLLSCNIFQLVYNSSLDQFPIGFLVVDFFTNEFKFNLLSYYYKLNFIMSQNFDLDQNWLSVPIEIWFKLPSFIKLIHDDVKILYPHHHQDLQICLIKLNSINSKFKIVDVLKNKNPITSWSDLSQVDNLLQLKFPDYCDSTYKSIPDDFNNKPLSTSTSIVKRSFSLNDVKEETQVYNESTTEKVEQPPKRSKSLKQISLFTIKKDEIPPLPILETPTKNQTIQHQVTILLQFRKKLQNLGNQLIEFLNLQLKYVKLWQNCVSPQPTTNSPYIKSIYQLYTEKLKNQILFTNETIIPHIHLKLVTPINECLSIIDKGVVDLQHLCHFIELIVKQYNQLYCDWLEGIIGFSSIKEYEKLYYQNCAKPNGDDIIVYYNQLLGLKNLMS